MTNIDDQFNHIHVNTGGKILSEDELKELYDFLESDEFKKMIEETDAMHKRVMESKITKDTKM
ncbi:MAG: hypothetical protein QP798_07060 [Staphylococcus simulans]|uniref:hypothetical protein n=1 Tax=Staphylococcus simulans TaxID=1286 RepID=UPI00255780EC|nr:hypothetical protein [Staphylococcus simulans]MDK7927112.1 hypothetical protein [Staphylococcus simulans]MDK8315689.1 hypothetical protein [Staphylococcus simulans]